MEQFSTTARQNEESARQADRLVVSASAAAAAGGQVVAKVGPRWARSAPRPKRYVDIIGLIDDIAFQTNILAQRSASAAKDIKTLIGDSVEKIESGSRLVDEAGSTLAEIVLSVRRATDIMSEITTASVEQSHGIGQVNQAVSQMDQITQQNAALVEEAAAASASLADQAVRLSQAISVFKLERAASAPVAARLPPRRPVPQRKAPPLAAMVRHRP